MRRFLIAAIFSFAVLHVSAQSEATSHPDAINSSDELALSDCVTEDGVRVLKYGEAAPASPYATAFDRREFFIALSDNFDALSKRIGATRAGQSITIKSSQLATPPEVAQIKTRHTPRKPTHEGNWNVFWENIQYAGQGSDMNFPIECGTALRSHPSKQRFIAVSECFAYENKERFLRTLGEINLNLNLVNFQCHNFQTK